MDSFVWSGRILVIEPRTLPFLYTFFWYLATPDPPQMNENVYPPVVRKMLEEFRPSSIVSNDFSRSITE